MQRGIRDHSHLRFADTYSQDMDFWRQRVTKEQEENRVEVDKLKEKLRESNESNSYIQNQVDVVKGDLAEARKKLMFLKSRKRVRRQRST